jgi:hypothetical protein
MQTYGSGSAESRIGDAESANFHHHGPEDSSWQQSEARNARTRLVRVEWRRIANIAVLNVRQWRTGQISIAAVLMVRATERPTDVRRSFNRADTLALGLSRKPDVMSKESTVMRKAGQNPVAVLRPFTTFSLTALAITFHIWEKSRNLRPGRAS